LEREIRNKKDLKKDLKEKWERISIKEVIVNR
jgi:hypothetical protein